MKTANTLIAAARRASGLTAEKAAEICKITRPTYISRESHIDDFRLVELVNLYKNLNEPGKKLIRDAMIDLFFS